MANKRIDKLNIRGAEYDVGALTLEEAISLKDRIYGENNSTGVKGFYIDGTSYGKMQSDLNSPLKWEFYLANTRHYSIIPNYTLSEVTLGNLVPLFSGMPAIWEDANKYFSVGDTVEICFGKKWWDFPVVTVRSDCLAIVVEVSQEFSDFILSGEIENYINYTSNEDFPLDEYSIYNKAKPQIGLVDLKTGGNTFSTDSEAQGNFSTVFGMRNKAYGDYALVQGRDSSGTYNNFIAGSYCHGYKDTCFVQGYQNEAHGDISFATGWNNTVKGRTGFVAGRNNTADGESSFVAGQANTTTASDTTTFVAGQNNKIYTTGASIIAGKDNQVGTAAEASNMSIVLGHGNTITGFHESNFDGINYGGNIILGHMNSADGTKSFSIVAGGRANEVSGHYASVVGGNVNKAAGWYSTVVGGTYGTVTASGNASAILGGGESSTQKNTVSGARSAIIAGKDNLVAGNEAFATGTGVTVSGTSAAAFGTKGSAYGYNAFIAGNSTNKASDRVSNLKASGMNSAVDTTFAADKTFHIVYGGSSASFGINNCITADYSYTFGEKNHIKTASNHSVAIGLNNTISSTGAFVAGKDNSHSNTDSAYSVIFGESNEIKNAKYSLTFGFDCANNSYYGLVGGYKSSNSGSNYSIAFGNSCKANGGEGSIAFGNGTITSTKYQLAIGRFNDNTKNTDALFVIGDGTSTSARKNVFAVGPTSSTLNGSFNVTGATTTAALKVNGTSEHNNIVLGGTLKDTSGIDLLGSMNAEIAALKSMVAELTAKLEEVSTWTVLD